MQRKSFSSAVLYLDKTIIWSYDVGKSMLGRFINISVGFYESIGKAVGIVVGATIGQTISSQITSGSGSFYENIPSGIGYFLEGWISSIIR